MPRAPILFSSYSGAEEDLNRLKQSNHKLGDSFIEFLERLIHVCKASNGDRLSVSRKEFTAWLKERGYPASSPVFSRHVDKVLLPAGCVNKSKRQFQGTRYDEYRLTDLHKLEHFYERAPTSVMTGSNELVAHQSEIANQGELLEIHDAQLPTTAALIQTLAVAFRFSARDMKSGGESPTWVTYQFRPNERVLIRAEGIGTSDGSNIATQSDRALLRALCSILREELQDKFTNGHFKNSYDAEAKMREVELELRRPYMIDLKAVALRVKGKVDTASLRSVARSLHRIRSTRLFVSATDSPTWRRLFHKSENSTESEYDLITELEGHNVAWEPGNYDVSPPRFIVMTFHSQLMASLLMSNQVFVGHEKLYSDWSGLAQALNDWQRAVIGTTDNERGGQMYKTTLTYLSKSVFGEVALSNGKRAPHYDPHQFSRDYLNLAKRAIESPEKVGAPKEGQSPAWTTEKGAVVKFWHYGYWHELHFDDEQAFEIDRYRRCKTPPNRSVYPAIYISRDINDRLVGNDSLRNRLVRKRQQDLNQQTSEPSAIQETFSIQQMLDNDWDWEKSITSKPTLAMLPEDDRVTVFDKFCRHHANQTDITARTTKQWEKLLIGYFQNAVSMAQAAKGGTQSTRSRTITQDLTDTSWAD